jgi:hypothetical protein
MNTVSYPKEFEVRYKKRLLYTIDSYTVLRFNWEEGDEPQKSWSICSGLDLKALVYQSQPNPYVREFFEID